MSAETRESTKLGKIYARTPTGQELIPQSWGELLSDIYIFASTCNGVMLISGITGSGKTTFAKILQDRKPTGLDIISVSPTGSVQTSNWLMDAISPWITSEKSPSHYNVSERIRSLSENDRPILICIDTPSIELLPTFVSQIFGMLNLADGCGLNLSFIIIGSPEFISSAANDSTLRPRIVLNSKVPALDSITIQAFVMNKIKNVGITTEQLSQEKIQSYCRESEGIPGTVIRLLASDMGSNHNHATSGGSAAGIIAAKKPKINTERKKNHNIEDLLAPVKK